MNEIIEKALNRGAPIETPVLFSILEFIKIFDNEELLNDYKNSCKEIVSKISNIIDIYGGDIILPVEAIISVNQNNKKILRFSPRNLFHCILDLLSGADIDEIADICDDKEKFKSFKEKVTIIKTPEELKNKLPRIYCLYMQQLEVNKNFLELENILNDRDIPLDFKLKNLSKITNNFKGLYSNFDLEKEQQFAKQFTMTLYLKRIMQALENMIDNFEEITNIYYNGYFEINNFNNEDENKLNLYIAAKFMEQIEQVKAENKQRYLFYLTNYFKENIETKITRVKIKLDGKKVTPINLYERYKKVLLNNSQLLAVNFSYGDFNDMTKEEINEFITAYLEELSANWEFLPRDDASIEKSIRTIAKHKFRKISLEERKQKEEKLLNLYMQKKNFFDQTDPYFRVKGKNTFDGYVGYIYSNSIVILEKFYDRAEAAKIAENEAIYIMNMQDFYELSQHSKTYLYTNHLCNRVYHRGLWQERVLEYINKKTVVANPTMETQKLISDKKVYVNQKKL